MENQQVPGSIPAEREGLPADEGHGQEQDSPTPGAPWWPAEEHTSFMMLLPRVHGLSLTRANTHEHMRPGDKITDQCSSKVPER